MSLSQSLPEPESLPGGESVNDEAPEGYRWEWVAEGDDWKLAEISNLMCRMQGCRKHAVAAIRRGFSGSRFDQFRWWFYCADHLYGRKIENGVVMGKRLVKIEEARSADGGELA